MRIALPVSGIHVATVFDFADTMLVVVIEDGRVSHEEMSPIPQTLPSIRIGRLRELNIDLLICGAISNVFAAMIWHLGIEVIPGITGEIQPILRAFLNGQLARPQYLLPGAGPRGRCGWWRGHGRQFRGGRRQR